MNDFWDPNEPVLSSQILDLLHQYSQISPSKHISHVKKIRSRAWQVRRYPCIGSYMFLELSMSQHAAYPQVLEALRSDAVESTLLDLGCCLGQDLRKLLYDGAPGDRLTGYDIEPKFFEVGYEAFQDKSHLQSTFLSGDFLAGTNLELGCGTTEKGPVSLPDEPAYDFIHAADFFHLWSWDKQIQAYIKAVLMLKSKPGCLLFGRNTGAEKARLLDQGPFANTGKDHTWLHDAESMRRMLGLVAEKSGRNLEFIVDEMPITDQRTLSIKAVTELRWTRRLSFTMRTI